MTTDDQAREALFAINEQASADRRLTGTIMAVKGRNVSVLLDGEGSSIVTAYRGVYEPSVGAGVTIERIPGTNFYKVVGVRDTALGANNPLPYDFERQGTELYYPLALEAINQSSYNVGDGLQITIYNTQYVDHDKLWHYINAELIDLITYVPDEDSVWIVIYVDLGTDTLEVYAHTTTDTPDGGWLDALNGLLDSLSSIVPVLAVQLDAGMTVWGDTWKVIKRGFSYAGKKIVRIPYYSPRDTSETVADASEISYSPADVGDYDGIPAFVNSALNELADRLRGNETDLATAEGAIDNLEDRFPVVAVDVSPNAISGQTIITTVDPDSDYLLIFDATDGLLKRVAPENLPASATLPVTTKGDLLGFSTVPARLPVGTNGQIPIADSTQTLGIRWDDPIEYPTKTRYIPETLYDIELDAPGIFDQASIDQTYNRLEVELWTQSSVAGSNDGIYLYFNNDTTNGNYMYGQIGGVDGSASGAEGDIPNIGATSGAGSADDADFGHTKVEIPLYAETNYRKLARIEETLRYSATAMVQRMISLSWESAAAINRITIQPDGYPTDSFIIGSRMIIRGYKNEEIGGGGENKRQALYYFAGTQVVVQHKQRIYNLYGSDRLIEKIFLYALQAPTGADLIVDVKVNGTSIFTSSPLPKIVAGSTTGFTTGIDLPTWGTDEYLEVAVTQIGSTLAGADLTVHVLFGDS